jgi:hypothetical protein
MCLPRFRAHWASAVRGILLLVSALSLLVGVGQTDDSPGAQSALRVMQLCCAVLIAGELWGLWALAAPGEAPQRGNAGDVATAALAVACAACVLADGGGLALAGDSALASSLGLLLFEVAMITRPAPDAAQDAAAAAAADGKEAGATTPLLEERAGGSGAATVPPLAAASPAKGAGEDALSAA